MPQELQARIEAMAEPVFVRDSALTLLAVNDALADLTGATAGQADLVLPDAARDDDRREKERRALVFGTREVALVFDHAGAPRYELSIERVAAEDGRAFLVETVTVLPVPRSAEAAPAEGLRARLSARLNDLAEKARRLAAELPEGCGKALAEDLLASAEAVVSELADVSAGDGDQEPEALPSGAENARVVILDDDGERRQRLLQWLEASGADAVAAADGEEALAIIDEAARLGLGVEAVLVGEGAGEARLFSRLAAHGVETVRLGAGLAGMGLAEEALRNNVIAAVLAARQPPAIAADAGEDGAIASIFAAPSGLFTPSGRPVFTPVAAKRVALVSSRRR